MEKDIDYLIKLVKEKDVPIERYTNLIRTNPIIQDKIFISALYNKEEIKENIAIELLELIKMVENSKYKTFKELSADELTECIIEVIEKRIK